MTDIIIEKLNAAYLVLHIEDSGTKRHVYEHFRYKKPNFQPNRFTKWDGTVRLFDNKTGKFPYGLLKVLMAFIKEHKYSFELDNRLSQDITPIDKKDFEEWVLSLKIYSNGKPITPYEYQIEAAYLSIKFGRLTPLAATSAGKSLIIYLIVRWYEEIGYEDGKTLIIVPSIGLVSQLNSDFTDYSSKNKWKVENKVHCIAEGAVRFSNKNIYISTWQSLLAVDDTYFHQFARIIIDETHLASGDSITKICNNAINAHKRVGLTGTLNGTELHELQVTGLLGPAVRIVTTKELQDAGRAAQTLVTFLNLDYPTEDRKHVFAGTYQDEIEFLVNHPSRNLVIKTLGKSLSGNSLFMFNRKDSHLVKLFDEMVAMNLPNKRFHMITGAVDADDREEIRQILENSVDGIDEVIFGIDRCVSTGMSIKKLHNLVLCHPSKSLIKTLQALGRLLRLHESKEKACIYDIIDNLEYSGTPNTTKKHGVERFKYYRNEGHKVEIRNYQMKSYLG